MISFSPRYFSSFVSNDLRFAAQPLSTKSIPGLSTQDHAEQIDCPLPQELMQVIRSIPPNTFITVGRGYEVGVRVGNANSRVNTDALNRIGRKQAEIMRDMAGKLFLRDGVDGFAPTNATLLDNAPISPNQWYRLDEGATVQLGGQSEYVLVIAMGYPVLTPEQFVSAVLNLPIPSGPVTFGTDPSCPLRLDDEWGIKGFQGTFRRESDTKFWYHNGVYDDSGNLKEAFATEVSQASFKEHVYLGGSISTICPPGLGFEITPERPMPLNIPQSNQVILLAWPAVTTFRTAQEIVMPPKQ